MTGAGPLRLRWSPTREANPGFWLTLQIGDDRFAYNRLTVGRLVRESTGPNTYAAWVVATGQVLRSNNRRRLQKRLKDAVCAELARVARRAA